MAMGSTHSNIKQIQDPARQGSQSGDRVSFRDKSPCEPSVSHSQYLASQPELPECVDNSECQCPFYDADALSSALPSNNDNRSHKLGAQPEVVTSCSDR